MLVAQTLRRNRRCRHIKCSSKPNAWVSPIRATSAFSSASPQRNTAMLTGCQHPSQLRSDPFERAATTRLTRHPTTRPSGQLLPRRRNSWVLFSDRPRRALRVRATPPAFVPHQPHNPPERRKVHQLHLPVTIRPQHPATAIAVRSRSPPADMHPQRLTSFVVDADHLNITQVPPTTHKHV